MILKNRVLKLILLFYFFNLIVSCATFHEQRGSELKLENRISDKNKKINHKFILIGDAGGEQTPEVEENFKSIKKLISTSSEPTTVLFLGNNIDDFDQNKSNEINTELFENKLDKQLNLIANFKGNSYFLSGNLDWNFGLNGLIFQKQYITSKLKDSLAFLPQKYEAISEIEINDKISLIVIDSEWFIQDWNLYPKINHESEIRSREDLFEKFKYLVNENQNKITIVAMHHPVLSGGKHAGHYSFQDDMKPLPLLGTAFNFWKRASGVKTEDMQYKLYQKLIKRIKAIVAHQPQVFFVSGHENNLQYINQGNIKQVISGSASKVNEARVISSNGFTSGSLGFSVLNVFEDKTVELEFFNSKEKIFNEIIYQEDTVTLTNFPLIHNDSISTSVYKENEIKKNLLYRSVFGKHYREIYAKEVKVPIINLDTVFNGLFPIISDRDDQSYFLRLKNKNGEEFEMRRLRKNPEFFLESLIFKELSLKGKIENTYLADFVNDFYTSAHPYIPLVVDELAKATNLNSSNSKLVYIPKQKALGKYNSDFGDEMYLLADYIPKSETEPFLNAKPIIGEILKTNDVLFFIQENSDYKIDEDLYLRSRLFDLLIGDWDRHPDQWNWKVFEKDNKIVFQPIAINRKHAFSKMDGLGFALLKQTPTFRHMHGFKGSYANPRWINKSAFPLDKAFLQNSTLDDWKKVAKQIVDSISNEVIEKAFSNLPLEVQNSDTQKLQKHLVKRRDGLVDFSEKYFNELMKHGIIFGTNSKNVFEIDTHKNEVEVSVFEENKKIKHFKYNPKITKNLWVYGLDQADDFIVRGEKSKTKIRLIGGENHDSYDIKTRNKVVIHDYKSEPNTIDKNWKTSVVLRDNYILNQYDYKNTPINIFTIIPDLDYNKDNGVMIGVNAKLVRKVFDQEDFSQQHKLRGRFDFATNGGYLEYTGKFRNNTRNWYFQVELNTRSANYTQNFFGYGNETTYLRDLFKENYFRIRTEQLLLYPSYKYQGRNGGEFLFGPTFESVKIMNTTDRFIDQFFNDEDYTSNKFVGIQTEYYFKNYNSTGNPTLGFHYLLHTGFKTLSKDFNKNHTFITSSLGFIVPINLSKSIAFETVFYGKTIIGKTFNFYQAADLGSNNYLRGYRANRFTGRSAFAHSSDLNFKIYEVNRGLLPFTYGLSLGFDYGRVWQDHDFSDKWHTSYGGGIWFDFLEVMRLKINMHKSPEELMFTFGLNFGL